MPNRKIPSGLRVILIGGTSHVGKSTLAQVLAVELGWEYQSTDKLARHPGRAWRNSDEPLPPHVREHYATLPVDELIADVLRHYEQNVLPQIFSLVKTRVAECSAKGLVLEGSAIWPEFVASCISPSVAAIWITASDELIEERMRQESRYASRSPEDRRLIDKFLARTQAFGARLQKTLTARRLPSIRVQPNETVNAVAERCWQILTIVHNAN